MIITSENDLITTRKETRKGFIEFAIEKNKRALPFIEEAKAFKFIVSQAKTPSDLLNFADIEIPLLTAAGISDKALKCFDEEAKKSAIKELIQNFLEPVGDEFIDELIYRFLLIKGDSLGGTMRNVIGALAQKKINPLFTFRLNGTEYFCNLVFISYSNVVSNSKRQLWN